MRTTPPTFDPVAKTMHWFVAATVLGLILIGAVMGDPFWSPPVKQALYTVHKSFGFLLLPVTLFRLVWRVGNPPPPFPAETMPRWQILAAKTVHTGLYLFTLLVPLAGWSLVSSTPYGIHFFGLFPIPNLPFAFAPEHLAAAQSFFKTAHESLASILAVLIVAHVGATFLHHFVERDDILLRIAPIRLNGWLNRLRGM